MGNIFFVLAALAIALALLGKRASLRTYGLMAAAAVVATVVLYHSS